jgi:hypothetical protein
MATADTFRRDDTGLTGLFGSMMGFTYASTLYTMRLMFTNPVDVVDRLRISLDNVSTALADSMRGSGKDSWDDSGRNVRDAVREDVEGARQTVRRAAESVTPDTGGETGGETLTGRKR